MIRTIALAMLAYSLMFWGMTLVSGGPNNTGAWPILWTMLKLGPAPEQAQQGAQTDSQTGTSVGQFEQQTTLTV